MKQLQEHIHDNLSEKNIRIFLAKSFNDSMDKGGFDGGIKMYEEQIAEFKAKIEACQKYDATQAFLKDRGWQWYDVSDHIEYNRHTFYGFVGTKEEKDNLFLCAE